MAEVEGIRTFQAPADAYDSFMGRYSRRLAPAFADFCGLQRGQRLLDVGCGSGAFTTVAIERLGPEAVSAVDPAPQFVTAVRERHPGLDVQQAPAEALPYDDDLFDLAVAQLVFHFVSQPEQGARELARVVRPGGAVGVAVWDFAEGMEMLRAFWDAALTLSPDAPDEARTMRFGRERELADLLASAGLTGVVEDALTVSAAYSGFDELWSSILSGIGPAGAYLTGKTPEERAEVRQLMYERVGRPRGGFALGAVARVARGTTSR
jgi:SAM-dependent methyltransferase